MLAAAIIAPGTMGAALGRRLAENGVRVLTSLQGRSAASVARAREAGLVDAEDEKLAEADCLLSVLPPRDALLWRNAWPLCCPAPSTSRFMSIATRSAPPR